MYYDVMTLELQVQYGWLVPGAKVFPIATLLSNHIFDPMMIYVLKHLQMPKDFNRLYKIEMKHPVEQAITVLMRFSDYFPSLDA